MLKNISIFGAAGLLSTGSFVYTQKKGFNFSLKDLQNNFLEIILLNTIEYLDYQFQNKNQINDKGFGYVWKVLKSNKQPVLENLNLMSINDEAYNYIYNNNDDCVAESSNNKWEIIYKDKNTMVHRRLLNKHNNIYEFKCTGTYNDISPLNFVETQNNLEYRRKWDENVITLEQFDEKEADTQIINWVVQFPYPMYARQYIYKRHKIINNDKNSIIIVSYALDTNEYPDSGKYVRVTKYASKLIVKAHTKLYEKGLDYTLIYYDDPRSSIPPVAYNWIINRGGPYFMGKIYEAAKQNEKFK